jgi:hypothetical protein
MIAHSMRLDELSTKIETISAGDTQKKKLWGAKNFNFVVKIVKPILSLGCRLISFAHSPLGL